MRRDYCLLMSWTASMKEANELIVQVGQLDLNFCRNLDG